MNGNKYLLDTNTIIALLQGDKNLIQLLNNAKWIGISIISYLEFLAFPNINQRDRDLFESFISRIDISDLNYQNNDLLQQAISIRKKKKVKLPDAVILATAINNSASLITADKQLLELKIDKINVLNFSK